MFDLERLTSMNAEYIRAMDGPAFIDRIRPWLDKALPESVARPIAAERLLPIANDIQERIKLLSEVVDYTDFFFIEGPLAYSNEELMGKGFRDNPSGALAVLEEARSALKSVEPWNRETIEASLRGLAERLELKPGVVFTPIRVAATGKRVAPPLFETLEVLGREKTDARLNAAAERLAPPDD